MFRYSYCALLSYTYFNVCQKPVLLVHLWLTGPLRHRPGAEPLAQSQTSSVSTPTPENEVTLIIAVCYTLIVFGDLLIRFLGMHGLLTYHFPE